eukprot:1809518-Rhodomonas_salina.2
MLYFGGWRDYVRLTLSASAHSRLLTLSLPPPLLFLFLLLACSQFSSSQSYSFTLCYSRLLSHSHPNVSSAHRILKPAQSSHSPCWTPVCAFLFLAVQDHPRFSTGVRVSGQLCCAAAGVGSRRARMLTLEIGRVTGMVCMQPGRACHGFKLFRASDPSSGLGRESVSKEASDLWFCVGARAGSSIVASDPWCGAGAGVEGVAAQLRDDHPALHPRLCALPRRHLSPP